RILQRVPHSRLGGQVHDAFELLTREQLGDIRIVRQVEAHETKPGEALELSQARTLQCDVVVLVQVVETDDFISPGQKQLRSVKADEPGSAGEQVFHRRPSVSAAEKTCLMS